MNACVDISRVVLETPRLLLRPWVEADLEDFYAYASVPGVGEMAGWPHHTGRDVSRQILERFIREKKTFALEEKASGRVIGSLGLEEVRKELGQPFDDLPGRELGYVLSRAYWGRGLMPEAAARVVEYCFGEAGMKFLCCCHFAENHQSRRVIEKLGFTHLKDTTFTTWNGEEKADRVYVLLAK